jgi:uncharacterized protein YjbI with pentapeptide repeats
MKAIKPLSLGLLHKPYRFDGQDRLVIVALGFFRLGADNREFLGEPAQWPEVLKRLPAEQPLDMAMPKPRGEVLAAAIAYAPEGRPVTEMAVRLQLGDIDKRLRVLGDRGWRYGTVPLHSIDAPAPFVQMPIAYPRAYGGLAHPGNPLGCGHTGSRFSAFVGVNQGAMPNLEYPDAPVTGHYKTLTPAGYGPLDTRWSPRKDCAGNYDQRWLKEQSPGLPLDLDWSVFNAAPTDQRIEGYFQGGERYRLEGLHPDKPVIEGFLPTLRVRAFAQRKESIEEVALNFDTVWLFPDAELGLALYRGELPVEESDAADLASLLMAYEHQADAPRSLAHYREALALRLEGRDALAHIANESALKPEPDATTLADRAREQADAEAEVLARSQVLLDAAHAELGDLGSEPPKAKLPLMGVLPKAALARGDADIAGLLARADALIAKARADGKAKLEALCSAGIPAGSLASTKVEAGRADATACAQGASNADPGASENSRLALKDTVPVGHKAGATQAGAEAIARAHGIPQRERADGLLDALGDAATPEQRAHIEALAGNDLDRLGRRAALDPVPPALSADAAAQLGAEVRRLLRAGESLAGRDLAGADLAGIDLAGADLRGALLERADLSGANLSHTQLAGAVLTSANLSKARLDGADLDGAGCNRINARGASMKQVRGGKVLAIKACLAETDLSGAHLEKLIAYQADLSGAVCDAAELPGALLLEAPAAGSRWRGARLEKAVFYKADLAAADFSGATLHCCVFAEAKAAASIWRGARMEKCFFIASDFTAADLSEVQATACGWRDGELRGANLAAGRFAQCDFSKARLHRARLSNARFPGAILQRTQLQGCQGDGLDLFQAQARMADFTAADLSAASFMQADLTQAGFHQARLEQARHLPAGVRT